MDWCFQKISEYVNIFGLFLLVIRLFLGNNQILFFFPHSSHSKRLYFVGKIYQQKKIRRFDRFRFGVLWLKSKRSSYTRLNSTGNELSVGNGNLNFYTWFDVDWGNVLHNFAGWMQIDDALVDAHLEAIPGLTTFTARCFTGSDAENLGWPSDWSLDAELLFLGAGDQVAAHFFQWTNIGRCQCDADAVNSRWLVLWFFQIFSNLSCLWAKMIIEMGKKLVSFGVFFLFVQLIIMCGRRFLNTRYTFFFCLFLCGYVHWDEPSICIIYLISNFREKLIHKFLVDICIICVIKRFCQALSFIEHSPYWNASN